MLALYFLEVSKDFNWTALLLGNEKWTFFIEGSFRALIMFIIIRASLSLLGKCGVKQLSVFEVMVIIGLGSAADPLFHKDVGILPTLIVFLMIVALYTFVTLW